MVIRQESAIWHQLANIDHGLPLEHDQLGGKKRNCEEVVSCTTESLPLHLLYLGNPKMLQDFPASTCISTMVHGCSWRSVRVYRHAFEEKVESTVENNVVNGWE